MATRIRRMAGMTESSRCGSILPGMLSPAQLEKHTKDSLAALAIRIALAVLRRQAWAIGNGRAFLMKTRSDSTASVRIHVRDLSQMFSSLDPSPFWDRDLDPSAAEFIEDEFSDKRSAARWHLQVHTQANPDLAGDLQRAIENYYGRMAAAARRQLKEHRRLGHVALLVGLAVFALTMSLRAVLLRFVGELPDAVGEGLIVLGWIALWRPTEMLAYEWVPIVRKRRLYERLAGVRVAVASEVT